MTRALTSHQCPVAWFRLVCTSICSRVPITESWFRDHAPGNHRTREGSLICPPKWCHRALANPLLASPALYECRFSDTGAVATSATRLTEFSLSRTHLSEAALQILLSDCTVWKYKRLEELTMDDATRLECLLGDVHLGASVTIICAPKLAALGYLMVGSGISSTATMNLLLRSNKDMEKVMGSLKCFPCLETLHIQGKRSEGQDSIISFDYYQKIDPLGVL
ncbi:uncharacterized protein LOC133889452 [Phragmites australis]|uniref:uncharacterized protein LOC133889452 n=1 Tax=Phragmites australis TaxID=29695 RepID=UPI002D79F67B|nr:uncharacterized protein LOC133889452 [Phragmites australis]